MLSINLVYGTKTTNESRSAQSAMNNLELSTWILTLFEDLEGLSENTVLHASALLMNLCQRTKGMKECVRDPSATLSILNELIEHDNVQIKTYVNGLLCSLFADEGMRIKARMIGMKEQLTYMKTMCDESMGKQIDFVIEKLASGYYKLIKEEQDEDNESEDGEELDLMDDDEESVHEMDEDLESDSTGMSPESILKDYYIQAVLFNMIPAQTRCEEGHCQSCRISSSR